MDALSGLAKLVYDTTGKKPTTSNSASTTIPSATTGTDSVNISPANTLDYLKTQAASLKASLPGMIANSSLQSSSSPDPLSALLDQFVNPTQTLLSSNPAGNFSPQQLAALQQEVASLKDSLPTMTANSLLAPLMSSSGDSINGILQNMSDQLVNLAGQIQQKTQA